MSSDELQSNGVGVNGYVVSTKATASFTSLTENRAHYAVGAPDVTIKFSGSDLLIQAHEAALTAGSTFFSEHFQRVSFLLQGTVSPS